MGTQTRKQPSKGTRKKSKVTSSPVSGQPSDSIMHYKFEPYQPLKDEKYMSEGQLKHFRNILETWKRELMKEVDHTISEMKEASILADPNDRATQEETFSLELRTRDRERKLIRKIEEALQLIDDKEYGYCESCGVEIGIRRLEARPTAFLCIDCKTLDEIRERNIQ
jgi:DnaK suppressor protein